MPDVNQNLADLEILIELGKEAGAIGLKWFGKDPEVWMKEGQSPVSEADLAIDTFLKEKLLEVRPDYGWLSEETDDSEARLNATRVFIVDPIDGTRGFINGDDQWCVSIAVVEKNRPVVGVLDCPALKQTLTAAEGGGSHCNGVQINARCVTGDESLMITGPRNFQSASSDISSRAVKSLPFVPSLAYRLGMIAMGNADMSLARASAKDWDLAAADIIAHEACARLSDMAGNQLRYNCEDVRHGTLVASSAHHHDEMLDLARQALEKQRT